MLERKHLPRPLRRAGRWLQDTLSWDPWVQRHWSQEGEDIVLLRLFQRQPSGFYVDVGAHDPRRFSNTYALYRRGWRGINIDARPGSKALFDRARPRDINLEVGVAKTPGMLEYHSFSEPALNGFDPVLSARREDNFPGVRRLGRQQVPVKPLADILDEHAPDAVIDFLTVDVEGLDLDVLASNDWARYRPRFVLAEVLGSSLQAILDQDVGRFMAEQGYEVFAKQVNTVFFRDRTPPGA